MFRGATRHRCNYGGFDLMVHVDADRYPYADDAFSDSAWNQLVINFSHSPISLPSSLVLSEAGTKLRNPSPWSRPPHSFTDADVDAALDKGIELVPLLFLCCLSSLFLC